MVKVRVDGIHVITEGFDRPQDRDDTDQWGGRTGLSGGRLNTQKKYKGGLQRRAWRGNLRFACRVGNTQREGGKIEIRDRLKSALRGMKNVLTRIHGNEVGANRSCRKCQ